jgi:DNA-binding transcriptional regulator YdaS (Cro superfamily)
MRFIDYLRETGLTEADFASALNDRVPAARPCTASAVKKWKYGERTPPAERIAQIEEVTEGKVSLRDWLAAAKLSEGVRA